MSAERTSVTVQPPLLATIGYTTVDVNIHPNHIDTNPGGGAYFAALAASRLLPEVGLITTVGSDLHAPHLSRLLQEGIHRIRGGKTARSTQTYVDEQDPTHRQLSVEWGVAPQLEGSHIPTAWLPFLQIIHLATMIPSQQFAILEFIRTHAPQTKIAIDTDQYLLSDDHHRETVQQSFAAADLGFANRHEYTSLSRSIDAMPEAVVKLDADGAIYLQKGRVIATSRAPRVNAVDVTGAGDIFAGTFLAAQLLQYTPSTALELATTVATYSVTQSGVDHLFIEGGI